MGWGLLMIQLFNDSVWFSFSSLWRFPHFWNFQRKIDTNWKFPQHTQYFAKQSNLQNSNLKSPRKKSSPTLLHLTASPNNAFFEIWSALTRALPKTRSRSKVSYLWVKNTYQEKLSKSDGNITMIILRFSEVYPAVREADIKFDFKLLVIGDVLNMTSMREVCVNI